MMKSTLLVINILIIAIIGFQSCDQKQKTEIRNEFKKYYEQYQVEGSFALYDQNADKYILYNERQFKEPFIPASTFKICNSLIGLETGVITDENFVIPWDSVARGTDWDKDHSLKTAFQTSAVWYYQELARRVGGEKMKYWLNKVSYGNADTSGGIDKFWLTGGLRVTHEQQIDFLKRLHDNKLPFSQRNMDIVKTIMIQKDTSSYTLRAKTGWSRQSGKEIGWYIGYIETKGNVYYFSNCVQLSSELMNQEEQAAKFVSSRKALTLAILRELKIMEVD
jgi:beta-lactamase class D